jgi:hypothetical protein
MALWMTARMLKLLEGRVWRVAVKSAKPDWTMVAISYLISAAIVQLFILAFAA